MRFQHENKAKTKAIEEAKRLMSEQSKTPMGDAIWQLRSELERLTNKVDGDTRRVLRIAMYSMETAGAMEDRKSMQQIDNQQVSTPPPDPTKRRP